MSPILENLRDKRIILASQSPRRKELLQGIGIEFEILVKNDIDEDFEPIRPFNKVAEYLAMKKAQVYKDLINEPIILITADTIVCTENEILNKPADEAEAAYMLRQLSGKKHQVITGVYMKSLEKEICFSAESTVFFDELEPSEISYYIKKYKPFDKAGAYGIQEWIGYIGIRRIEGSYFNVMGLPVQMVYAELKKW
jgi:septum formation protein